MAPVDLRLLLCLALAAAAHNGADALVPASLAVKAAGGGGVAAGARVALVAGFTRLAPTFKPIEVYDFKVGGGARGSGLHLGMWAVGENRQLSRAQTQSSWGGTAQAGRPLAHPAGRRGRQRGARRGRARRLARAADGLPRPRTAARRRAQGPDGRKPLLHLSAVGRDLDTFLSATSTAPYVEAGPFGANGRGPTLGLAPPPADGRASRRRRLPCPWQGLRRLTPAPTPHRARAGPIFPLSARPPPAAQGRPTLLPSTP
jgi:hypothetical protein